MCTKQISWEDKICFIHIMSSWVGYMNNMVSSSCITVFMLMKIPIKHGFEILFNEKECKLIILICAVYRAAVCAHFNKYQINITLIKVLNVKKVLPQRCRQRFSLKTFYAVTQEQVPCCTATECSHRLASGLIIDQSQVINGRFCKIGQENKFTF